MTEPGTASRRLLRVLVVDDEALARQRLLDLLAKEEAVDVVAALDNGAAAVEAIRALRPDLLFLDVQMPGKSGLDVAREMGADLPATVFVTAYDSYALQAFDVAAVDYLVKPFDDDRFDRAFRRARGRFDLEEVGRLSDRLLAVLQGRHVTEGGALADPGRPRYLERIAVETRGRVHVVPVSEVEYVSASGPYVELHAGAAVHVIRERMQTLEERLDPERFFRIHRSAIVRLDLVETLLRSAGGDYGVRLKGGVTLRVSRSRFEELERRMGLTR